MNKNDVIPFIKAVGIVLNQFGLKDIKYQSIQKKEEMIIEKDVSAFLGIVGDMSGNVAYCFSEETGKKLASLLMMGEAVDEIDSMANSAVAEVSNMISGTASGIFEKNKIALDITPPTVISGKDITLILSFLDTHTVTLTTPIGPIEINISLEK